LKDLCDIDGNVTLKEFQVHSLSYVDRLY